MRCRPEGRAANALAEFVVRPASSSITRRCPHYKKHADPLSLVVALAAVASTRTWGGGGLGGLPPVAGLPAPLRRQCRTGRHRARAGAAGHRRRRGPAARGARAVDAPRLARP